MTFSTSAPMAKIFSSSSSVALRHTIEAISGSKRSLASYRSLRCTLTLSILSRPMSFREYISWLMNVPRPLYTSKIPWDASILMASLKVARLTPRRAESTFSLGSCSPGENILSSVIILYMSSATCCTRLFFFIILCNSFF